MRRNPALFAILVGGGVAGACDISYAIVFSAFRGVRPIRILHSVASGLLGSATGPFLHMFCIGLPIALATRKASGREAA